MTALEALTHAIGEELAALHGAPATRLTAPLGPSDVVASVETTYKWPDSGAFFVRGIRFTYSGKTLTTLTGVASTLQRILSYSAGTDLHLDPRSIPDETCEGLSLADKAWRDTLVHRVEGNQLARLSRMYGVPMPAGWVEADWREALLSVANGPRGAPGSVLAFLGAALASAEQTLPVVLQSAFPQRIFLAATQKHVGRLVRIDTALVSGLFCVVGPHDVAGAGGTYLELAKVDTAAFKGANWASLPPVTVGTAAFLSFSVSEPTPGPERAANEALAGKVILDVHGVLSSTPPTYLQPAGALARPLGQPNGGHLQADEWTDKGSASPIYLTSDNLLAALGDALKLTLAAGIRVLTRKGIDP